MKGKLLTIGFSLVVVSILMSSLVYASWSTLGTGYAVTSNINGTPLAGNPVTIIAGTLDPTVNLVTFRWLAPPNGGGACLLEETVAVYTDGTMGQWNNGTQAEIRYAQSTFKVYEGTWKVEVIFHTSSGELTGEQTFRVDASDVGLVPTETGLIFHTPELPIGTIGAAAAMVAALGLFAVKKRRQQK
jgi:hypothetical protein